MDVHSPFLLRLLRWLHTVCASQAAVPLELHESDLCVITGHLLHVDDVFNHGGFEPSLYLHPFIMEIYPRVWVNVLMCLW